MPDILDELRTELDSAFERAEERPPPRGRRGVSARGRRSRALKVMAPVTAAALALAVAVAYAPRQEGIPADERAVPANPQSGPVRASVYPRSAGTRPRQVQLDKGLDDGVHRGDPVIDGAGLVGTVTESAHGSSVVTLITDRSFATSVYVGRARHAGSITSATGSPGELLFEPVDASADVRAGDLVHTAGTIDPALRSRYPRALPIGRVSRIELGNGTLVRRIYVRPAARLSRLGVVQVLTRSKAAGGG